MDFSVFRELPELDQNFLKILESSEQVEIVGEDGGAVHLPLLLLCLHSDLVSSIVNTLPRHTPVSIHIPVNTEAVQDLLANITKQENKASQRSLFVYEVLGIKVNHELEQFEDSSAETGENRKIKNEDEASLVSEDIIDDNFIDSQINFPKIEMVNIFEYSQEDALKSIMEDANVKSGIDLVSPVDSVKENVRKMSIDSENEMTKTKSTHSTLMSYSCTLCDYKTKYKGNVKEHNEIVHLKIRHKCDQCGIELTHKGNLRKHKMRVHSSERPFICQVCSYSFKAKKDLKKHMESVHSLQSHVCKDCGKIFNNIDALKVHNRYHDENLQLRCELCGKGFVSGQKLKEHINTHAGKKPYICLVESCSAAFTSSASFSYHKKTCVLQKG